MDQNKSSNIQETTCNNENKLSGTVSAASTSAFFHKKKLSLHTCWSSISIEVSSLKSKFKKERALLLKYLEAKYSGADTQDIAMKMKVLYNETPSEAREEKMTEFGCIDNKPQQYLDSFEPILEYFMVIWLLNNGYRTQSNKVHVLSQVKLQVPMDNIHEAISFYETFGTKYLTQVERKKLMEETCRNGWEYFSFQIIKQLKRVCRKRFPLKSH